MAMTARPGGFVAAVAAAAALGVGYRLARRFRSDPRALGPWAGRVGPDAPASRGGIDHDEVKTPRRSARRDTIGSMKISYRVGVMPGPWPERADTRDFLWALIDLCERT